MADRIAPRAVAGAAAHGAHAEVVRAAGRQAQRNLRVARKIPLADMLEFTRLADEGRDQSLIERQADCIADVLRQEIGA